jgi:putative ABC transport system permease protein
MMVLVGAGLAIRSAQALLRIDAGFDPTDVISGRIDLPASRYPSDDAWIGFHVELERRLSLLPRVEGAGLTSALPLGGSASESGILPEGRPLPGPGDTMTGATFYAVSPSYFGAVGTRIVAGRTFTARDTAGTPLVAVVDERLARAFWPGERAIGRRVAFEMEGGGEQGPIRPIWREVVGVVETVRHYGLTVESPRVQIYTPVTQLALWFRQRRPSMALVLRTSAPAEAVMADVRRAVADLDRDIPVHSIVPVRDFLDGQTASARLTRSLMTLFGALALALAVIGVYGVMTHAVGRRTQEFGIRLALGASSLSVFSLVARHALWLLAGGLVLGSAGSLALVRFAPRVFVDVEPADPATFVAVAAILALVIAVASAVPARRAVRVDPLAALRHE